jgi:hypothetical protein
MKTNEDENVKDKFFSKDWNLKCLISFQGGTELKFVQNNPKRQMQFSN